MPASLVPFLLAAAAAPAAAPLAGEAQDGPLLVAHADGSWTIARAVAEDPPSLAFATDGLLAEEPGFAPGPATRDALRDAALERQAEDAFEDSIEAARRDQRPN